MVTSTSKVRIHPKTLKKAKDQTMRFCPHDGLEYTWKEETKTENTKLYHFEYLTKDGNGTPFFAPAYPEFKEGVYFILNEDTINIDLPDFKSLFAINAMERMQKFIVDYKFWLDLLTEKQWDYELDWGVFYYEH